MDNKDNKDHKCKEWAVLNTCTKDSGRDYSTWIEPTDECYEETSSYIFHWMGSGGDFSYISVCTECGKVQGFDPEKSKKEIKELRELLKDDSESEGE